MSVESLANPRAAGRTAGSASGRARAGLPAGQSRTRPRDTAGTSALRVVAGQRARASRAWFLGIVLGLLGMGLVGLLLLNTASAQDAFRLHDLQTRAADLSRQEQSLSLQASVLADPATLAGRAGQLGMVPGGDPRFLAPGAALPAGCLPVADGCVIPAPRPAQPSAQPTKPPVKQPIPHSAPGSTPAGAAGGPTRSKPAAQQPTTAGIPKTPRTPTTSQAPAPAHTVPARLGGR